MATMISVVSISTVHPKTPTPQPCTKPLSNLDLMSSSRSFTKQVYFYKPPPSLLHSDTFSALLSRLIHSLSLTLSHFFPLAGRLLHPPPTPPADDHHSTPPRRLLIDCNDAGIPFTTALAHCRLSDWDDLQDCLRAIEHQLNPAPAFVLDYSDAPLIQIQVTKFLCGSIALGYVFLETVGDGYSAIEFMRAWSEMHRTGSISNLPLFEPHLLKPRYPPTVSIPIRDYKASKAAPTALSVNYRPMFEEDRSQSPYCSKLFTFTPNKIDALVEEIGNSIHGSRFRATSFEAMSGLVWKCMTEARELRDDETTIYNYAVSLRSNINRWKPEIPANYFGNAVHIANLDARAGDIKGKHVGYVARLVHEDIQELSAETVKSTVDWMQVQMEKGLEVGYNCDLYSGKVANVTSMYTFPIYDTDFGWGRPLHFSFVVQPWYGDGVAYFFPTPQGGRSRYLLVSLPQEHLHKLSMHPLFVAFATPTRIPTRIF